MRRCVGGLLLTLLLTGCYTVSYKGKGSPSGVEKEEWTNFFLWGLAPGSNDVDLQKLCPTGPARWKSQQSFVQGLIGFVTLGIYIPRSVYVECATGTALEIRLDPWTGKPLIAAAEAPGEAGRAQ